MSAASHEMVSMLMAAVLRQRNPLLDAVEVKFDPELKAVYHVHERRVVVENEAPDGETSEFTIVEATLSFTTQALLFDEWLSSLDDACMAVLTGDVHIAHLTRPVKQEGIPRKRKTERTGQPELRALARLIDGLKRSWDEGNSAVIAGKFDAIEQTLDELKTLESKRGIRL